MDKIETRSVWVNTTRIHVCPENRKELSQTICSLLGLIGNEEGCLAFHFYEEAGDENSFVLISEWETLDCWGQHVMSDNFAVLLGSIMILSGRSNTDFKLLSQVADIKAVAEARRVAMDHPIDGERCLTMIRNLSGTWPLNLKVEPFAKRVTQ